MKRMKIAALAAVVAFAAQPAFAGEVCTGAFGSTPTALERVSSDRVNYTFGDQTYKKRQVGVVRGQRVFWVDNSQRAWVQIGNRRGNQVPITWNHVDGRESNATLTCGSNAAADQLATLGG